MKANKWLFYLVYAVVLFGYSFFGLNIINSISEHSAMLYDFFSQAYISAIIFFILGVILGIPNLISEIKKEGKWKVNLPRLILIGIPSLFLSLQIIFTIILQRLIFFYVSPSIFQIIFGYILITSFYKEKNPL